jgi:hypothetical protein
MEIAKASCLSFLKTRFPTQTFNMISCFSSYVTGLKFFHNGPKPIINSVYNCKRMPTEQFPNAIQVFSHKKGFGYVPRDLADALVPQLDKFLESRILLCFCNKVPTQFSASCFYMIFELIEDNMEICEQIKVCNDKKEQKEPNFYI